MASPKPVRGTVLEFDADVGLGRLVTSEGTEVGFHAAVISDGTRSIAVGAEVLVEVRANHGGRLDARAVVPL